MTIKTIPEYLEDQRRRDTDTHLRTEEEAARVQALHHGRHRTPKQPKPDLSASVEVAVKARKTSIAKTRKTVAAKTRKPVATAGKKQPVEQKTGTKTRKRA